MDRAEQVWKSVRGNKRVAACPEGPLLEARALLKRGDFGGAVKALVETEPVSGVVWVERLLLLAWAEVAQNRRDKAMEFLKRVSGLPYPRVALDTWRRAVEEAGPSLELGESAFVPAVLRDLGRGYRALGTGNTSEAIEAFRAALNQPVAAAFARYSLAWVGHDDYATVLAAQPGFFLAVRCRVWLALERFRRRQGTPAEWIETLQRESRRGFVPGRVVEHYRMLALILCQSPTAESLRQLVEEHRHAEPAVRRNIFRAVLEMVRRLSGEEAKVLLAEWAKNDWIPAEIELSQSLRLQSLRLALRESNASEHTADLLRDGALLQPASELWQAARAISEDDSWRERVRGLKSTPTNSFRRSPCCTFSDRSASPSSCSQHSAASCTSPSSGRAITSGSPDRAIHR